MASVTYQGASRIYKGATTAAVDRVDLDIADGEFMVLVGPSGSGKSTALRMLAGLEGVDEGSLYIGDRDVTRMTPADRDIAMVFQNYALYPHMTVEQNIGYHLKVAKYPKDEIRRRVVEAAQLLEVGDLLDRKPARLSGGQRQRVAMGRAIVREPQVFLMDEPLSNLDAKLRVATRAQISALQRRLGTTTVYVTHDQVEAMTMGDRVAVLHEGVLQQCDTPERLFDEPANVFVAGFIGSPAMNLMAAPLTTDGVQLGDLLVPVVPTQTPQSTHDTVTLGVRPEGLRVVAPEEGLPVTVEAVEELGTDAYLHASTEVGGRTITVIVRHEPRSGVRRGTRMGVRPDVARVHLFDPASGDRIETVVPADANSPGQSGVGVVS